MRLQSFPEFLPYLGTLPAKAGPGTSSKGFAFNFSLFNFLPIPLLVSFTEELSLPHCPATGQRAGGLSPQPCAQFGRVYLITDLKGEAMWLLASEVLRRLLEKLRLQEGYSLLRANISFALLHWLPGPVVP